MGHLLLALIDSLGLGPLLTSEEQQITICVLHFESPQTIIATLAVLDRSKELDVPRREFRRQASGSGTWRNASQRAMPCLISRV
jgi:hypothetical protein